MKKTAGTADRVATPDVSAEEVAERMLQKYVKAKSYADSASYVHHYVVRGEGVERERPFFELALAMERPNFLRLTFKESIVAGRDSQAYDIACDGKELRVAASAMPDQVFTATAPAELNASNFLPDPLLRGSLLAQSLENVFPQLAMFWNKAEEELVFPQDGAPKLLPSRALGKGPNKRPCFRLETTSPSGKRVLWIDQESYALLRMELPLDRQKQELDPEGQYMEQSVWIDFRDPVFDASVDAASFKLAIPEGATPVIKLTAPVTDEPSAVLGAECDDLIFYDSKGKKRPLGDFADKIVVLDFWQVDCPPCKKQAELIETVRESLGPDAKVEFVGVNVDRKDAPVALLEKTWGAWEAKFPWLADYDRKSLSTLQVAATPTLVVLDGKSKVQVRRPGPLDSAEELTTILTDLQEGRDLAAEARAAYEAKVAEHRRAVEANKWAPEK